jgi:hypothetical protein
MATGADVLKKIKDEEVRFVDLRFTDFRGKEQHVQVPHHQFTNDKFVEGHAFDGSSIAGWKGIEASDMLLMPDPNTGCDLDPFIEETTLVHHLRRHRAVGPARATTATHARIAKRAEAYLKTSQASATRCLTSVQNQSSSFLIRVEWKTDMSGSFSEDLLGAKPLGNLTANATKARVQQGPSSQPSKAVTSQFLQSINLQDLR